MIKLTELEIFMLKKINEDYEESGINDTEFYNTFGMDAKTNKELRGAFSSLKRKKIIDHCNDPGCFNPIYPTKKFIDVLQQYGIEVSENAKRWVRYDELWDEYYLDYQECLNNKKIQSENISYSFYQYLKDYHNIDLEIR